MENQTTLTMSIDLTNQNQTAALAGFFFALSGGQPVITSELKEAPIALLKAEAEKPVAKEKPVVKKPEVAAEVATETSKAEEPADAPETSNIKVEDVRALLQKKVTNNRDEIKKKLTEFKANNVTALDAKHYADFMEFLNSLD